MIGSRPSRKVTVNGLIMTEVYMDNAMYFEISKVRPSTAKNPVPERDTTVQMGSFAGDCPWLARAFALYLSRKMITNDDVKRNFRAFWTLICRHSNVNLAVVPAPAWAYY